MVFAWVLKNPRVAAGIFAFFTVAAILGYVYWKGGDDKVAAIENKTVKEAVKLKGKQDDIARHRPDTQQLIDRLRAGTY